MALTNKEVLKGVPYITNVPSDGRAVFLLPYFDQNDKKFKMYIPQGNKLTWLFAEPFQSCYYAESLVDISSDIYLKTVDVIVQHYSFEPVLNALIRINMDIINCGVVVEKYFIFLNLFRNTKDVSISNLVETDLEYFFANVRSIYDLLQNMIRYLWRLGTKKALPDSMRRMVQLESDNLQEKYNLPKPLIDYYLGTKDFFMKCREIRDNIYHFKGSYRTGLFEPIFCIDDGFAFKKDDLLFPNPLDSIFDIWPPEKTKKNGLISVLALISYINKKVLENIEAFSQTLIESVKPLPPISKTCKVFLRSPYIHHILKSDEYLDKHWI